MTIMRSFCHSQVNARKRKWPIFVISRLFVVNPSTLAAVRVFRGGNNGDAVGAIFCGILGQEDGCDLSEASYNLYGSEVTAAYDDWPPFCVPPEGENGRNEPTGIFPSVLKALAEPNMLNFSVNFVANPDPGIWGSGLGSKGAVPAVRDGKVTTAIMGITVTVERSESVDFTTSVALAKTASFVRRPSGDGEVSVGAYTSEFRVSL